MSAPGTQPIKSFNHVGHLVLCGHGGGGGMVGGCEIKGNVGQKVGEDMGREGGLYNVVL